MFDCYLKDGTFMMSREADLHKIVDMLDVDRLYRTPIDVILEFLSKFAKELIRRMPAEEGVFYLASWLRKSNLRRFLEINFDDPAVLDRFIPKGEGLMLRAQPRGIVCHWVAGNVPTLSIFSLVQSILAKNANILRVPREALEGTIDILKILGKVEIPHHASPLRGSDVLKTISLLYCPSDDRNANRALSMAADCKVVWGGAAAVKSITALEQREHCETVVFGPKYSFAVMDSDSIQDDKLHRLVMDIITFQQEACSSPHVVFCEKQNGGRRETAVRLAAKLAEAFKIVGRKFPKPPMAYPDVMNIRGVYWLDPEKDILSSEELDWTILIDDDLRLEEPVKFRTIFIKEVNDVLETIPLITNRVQTIGVSIGDRDKAIRFCEAATRQGVARCVPFGMMNNYDAPWDGLLFINRLVRWTSLRENTGTGKE